MAGLDPSPRWRLALQPSLRRDRAFKATVPLGTAGASLFGIATDSLKTSVALCGEIVMRAIRMHAKRGPEQLVYEDAPRPLPAPGDGLVRVHAAGVTPTELSWSATWETQKGESRLPVIPGHELSGTVEAIGAERTSVAAGDAVYALTDFWRDGAAAEYVTVRARDLVSKRDADETFRSTFGNLRGWAW
jgi:alcohol dehydrogenase-like protein